MKIFTTLALVLMLVWVNGYYRNNGTYVQGHYRTSPDKYEWNNDSYRYNSYPLRYPSSTRYYGTYQNQRSLENHVNRLYSGYYWQDFDRRYGL